MRRTREIFRNTLVVGIASIGFGATLALAPAVQPLAHADADYGGGCVLYDGDRAATIDSLRFRCGPGQLEALYRDAPQGVVPTGVRNGWVAEPADMQVWSPALWIGKTFYTGPDGGYLLNRVTGAGLEVYQADVYRGPSVVDGGPTWVLNYRPSPTPQLWDEIREVTPGVWFGYSYWRDGRDAQLLSFILT